MSKTESPGPRPPPLYAGLAASLWLGAPVALPMGAGGADAVDPRHRGGGR